MIVLAALLLAAPTGAKLIMPGQPATVVNYPSMQRCRAAKASIERQNAEKEQRDRAKGVIWFPPMVYCVPN